MNAPPLPGVPSCIEAGAGLPAAGEHPLAVNGESGRFLPDISRQDPVRN